MSQSNEEITRRVSEMYERFPYPSPETGTKKLKELSNLLTIFSRETGYAFGDKRVLDAGTGTGHRLLEAARNLKDTKFLAVDVSERPLSIARATAKAEGIENVAFRTFDLMDESTTLGTFDVVLCMGVLHHLADPTRGLRNLARHLTEHGILFIYVYGRQGSFERMCRKQIVATLLGQDQKDFDRGLQFINDLGFDLAAYGWNLNTEDEKTKESLAVDSYLNVHESLFEFDSLFQLFGDAGLDGFTTFGITAEHAGYLFDSRLYAPAEIMLQRTEITKKLTTPRLIEAYERLDLRQRYRLMDLLYQPNGYTVVGFRLGARALFKPEGRIMQNAIWHADFS